MQTSTFLEHPGISMRQHGYENNVVVSDDPRTGSHNITAVGINDDDDDDATLNGIDVTKSLYHLRLHGFDVVAKNHDTVTGEASSPSRLSCVTPAVSPVRHVFAYRKRLSLLPMGQHVPICKRQLSTNFLEMTPTRARQVTALPHKGSSLSNLSNEENGTTRNELVKPTKGTKTITPSLNTDPYSTTQFLEEKPLQRVRSTTITDEMDEFEVMLESSVSSDDRDEEYQFRNESSILDSPESLPSVAQNDEFKDKNDYESYQNHPNSISPQTPAHLSFCGIPSWCETPTAKTNRHLFLDDGSITTVSQLHHRSSNEWFLCPSAAVPECCATNSNNADPGSRQITVIQNMLQNHICTSLGDSMETLCWQKSATSMFSKASSIPTSSIPSLPSMNEENLVTSSSVVEDTKVMKTKHRRSSTLPMHRRTNKFATLQYNLHPFDSDTAVESTLKHNHHLQPQVFSKSLSFQLIKQHNKASATRKKKVYSHSEVGIVVPEWECGALDFVLAFDDTDATKSRRRGVINYPTLKIDDSKDATDDGYESDPELFCREQKVEGLPNLNPRPLSSQVSYTVQEFLNERSTFILHATLNKSIAVHVWVELGQQLYDTLVLPKLCWRPILSSQESSQENSKVSRRKLSIVGEKVSSMELLNICRVRQVDAADRKEYPFAQTQRLFSIQSTESSTGSSVSYGGDTTTLQQHNLILEARSISDRIRYTNLLKLTVSTLAAKFITNDPNTLTTFFHSPTMSDYDT